MARPNRNRQTGHWCARGGPFACDYDRAADKRQDGKLRHEQKMNSRWLNRSSAGSSRSGVNVRPDDFSE